MNRRFQLIFTFSFFFIKLYSQENAPWKMGEKILNEKIEKYKNIDSLEYNAPIKAAQEQKLLDFQVYLSEGNLVIDNKKENYFGTGGFSVYNFVNDKSKKDIKIEYNETKHFYSDSKYKNYRNSELRKITIFFNDNHEPDLAKIYENQYDNEKVLSSTINFITLPEKSDYIKNTNTKGLLKTIEQIVTNYKK